MDVGFFNVFFDLRFDATLLSAMFAFATIVTLGLPMLERNALGSRMKAVAERREELRRKHQAALKQRGGLRSEPLGFIKQTVERLQLSRIVEAEQTRQKLARAGYRGQGALVTFVFFRFAMPFIVFVAALIYLFFIYHPKWSPFLRVNAALGFGLAGFYLPDLFLSNRISKRQASIMGAFPDALDLMLICVESGMSVEAAFTRVSAEVGVQSPELAEELALTTAELSYLPDRRLAYDNLAKRCGHSGVRAVAAAVNQAEKYGTPVGSALRVTAKENRETRMMDAEKKAAALSPKLTVPMLIFFLPCLFVVIIGPAVMNIMHTMHH
ncbi:MAG TPA: type II secretion system F family protein [Rhizomicrobium sp.]|jgi:tight adherence protein C|nr:type II secretion system F family protein [Rhizomicrobium sp.]